MTNITWKRFDPKSGWMRGYWNGSAGGRELFKITRTGSSRWPDYTAWRLPNGVGVRFRKLEQARAWCELCLANERRPMTD